MIPVFIKIFQEKALVVECRYKNGGDSIEYDPFHPEKRWAANVKWNEKDEVIINVDVYSVKAKRVCGTNVFLGDESGPYGTNKVEVYLLDLKQAKHPMKMVNALRFAKIAEHRALIIDCDAKGNGKEYDPFYLNEKWDVSVLWPTNDEVEIITGPYCLKAWRVLNNDGADFFRGIETGPEGNFAFRVYLLSSNSHTLVISPATEWLLFRSGEEYDRGDNPRDEERWYNPKLRRKGVAWLKFPDSISETEPGISVCFGRGILGGKNEEIKVAGFPTEYSPALSLEITSNEQLGKFTWYDYGFKRDDILCAYVETTPKAYPKEDSMILFPVR